MKSKASIISLAPNILVVLLGVAVWVAIIGRVVPDRLGDRGIFVSVAEHLLRGGTLYVTTYDNKEPLFFYFVAAQRALGAWAEVLAEALLVTVCAFSSYALARTVSDMRASLIVGLIIVPIIVTGVFYFPGGTHLPATAVILTMLAAIAGRSFVSAGGLLALVVFLKIPAIPVAFATAFAMLIFTGTMSGILRFAIGAMATIAVIVGLLIWRGEFVPFYETVVANVRYAQGGLVENSGFVRGLIVHIGRVWGRDFYTEVVAISLALTIAIISFSPARNAERKTMAILSSCVMALLSTVIALALTGLWQHHNQALYVAAALAAVSVSRFLDMSLRRAFASTVIAALCFAYFLGGAFPLRAYFNGLANFRESYADLNRVPPETARLLALAPSGVYARFGRYDDRGHAIGLSGWKLACSRFHQGSHEPEEILKMTFDCAARVPVLLIGADFATELDAARWPAWKAHVDRVEALLAKDYNCDAASGLRLCVRRH